jgi:DNA-binding MarR family transcriptional regulator
MANELVAEIDQESRTSADDHQALRLWLRLLTCTKLIERQIRAQLRTHFDVTLPRFDLMAQLEREPNGLKMGELSMRMMVTEGNITGITHQLEKEGLVVRTPVPEDRRASVVKLTPEGRKSFRRMAREHERWLVEMFSQVDSKTQHQLHAFLGELKQASGRNRKSNSNR